LYNEPQRVMFDNWQHRTTKSQHKLTPSYLLYMHFVASMPKLLSRVYIGRSSARPVGPTIGQCKPPINV